MLILNAGHKPVKTQHQLELLFRHLIPVVKSVGLEQFELIREKNMSSITYSKNRKRGQFHFSHLITSILSLNEGKPVTTNVGLVHKTQSADFNFDEYDKYFNYDFLHKFISTLLLLDENLANVYQELGTKWISREVSLVGMFAALGKYSIRNKTTSIELLDVLKGKIINRVECLNLEQFERVRNSLDLSKINIGTVNKNAIYNGVYDILNGNETEINWKLYFRGQMNEEN